MPTLTRFRRLMQDTYCSLLLPAYFKASPFERGYVLASDPYVVDGGYSAIADQDRLRISDRSLSCMGTVLHTVDDTKKYILGSWRSPYSGYYARPDMRLLSIEMSGNGGTATFDVIGRNLDHTAFQYGRGIGVYLTEFYDPMGDSPGSPVCFGNSHVLTMFILDNGGKAPEIGPDGLSKLTLTVGTPDKFLDTPNLPKLPYLNANVAKRTRQGTAAMSRTEGNLGHPVLGAGPITADPLSGFAYFRDLATASPGALMSAPPCNERHLLGSDYNGMAGSGSSPLKALFEVLSGHVLVDRGAGYKSILTQFDSNFDLANDPENNVVSFELGPGSINEIIMEACRHAGYQYFWDSRSKLYIIPEYCYPGRFPASPYFSIKEGRSMVGNVKVIPGTDRARVNRAWVTGQWTNSITGDGPPLASYFESGHAGNVYPPGATLGNPGFDIVFENLMGASTYNYAHYLYNKESQKDTFTWEGCPFVGMALGAFGKRIDINIKDPMGVYDYSVTPRSFRVDNISVQLTDPERLIYTANVSGAEIRQ